MDLYLFTYIYITGNLFTNLTPPIAGLLSKRVKKNANCLDVCVCVCFFKYWNIP